LNLWEELDDQLFMFVNKHMHVPHALYLDVENFAYLYYTVILLNKSKKNSSFHILCQFQYQITNN